jgi:AcrR family transcriptional regulator
MAVRLTRAERKAETRERILTAALTVFLERGFHGATLDEIAEEAGYTKGAVYSNFEGKDDLFLALLDERFGWRIAESVEAAREAASVEDALRANARMIAETAQRQPTWDALLVEFWTHASRDRDVREAAAARHDRVLDAIGELLDGLSDRFEVEWTISTREIARAATAFARGMAVERLLDPEAVPAQLFEEQFLAFTRTYLRSSTLERKETP